MNVARAAHTMLSASPPFPQEAFLSSKAPPVLQWLCSIGSALSSSSTLGAASSLCAPGAGGMLSPRGLPGGATQAWGQPGAPTDGMKGYTKGGQSPLAMDVQTSWLVPLMDLCFIK